MEEEKVNNWTDLFKNSTYWYRSGLDFTRFLSLKFVKPFSISLYNTQYLNINFNSIWKE